MARTLIDCRPVCIKMKKNICLALSFALALCLLGAFPVAAHAGASVALIITAVPDAVSPGDTTDLNVAVTVGSGNADQVITNVELYLTGGSSPIATWGRIGAGRADQQTVKDIFVAPSMLGIPYPVELRYIDFDGSAAVTEGSFIVFEAVPAVTGEVRLLFTRTADAKYVTPGGAVNLFYTIRNDGTDPLLDVEISDELFGHITTVAYLAPGQREEYVMPQRAMAEIVSTPRVAFTNSITLQRETADLEPLTLPLANPKMTVSLKADETQVKAGDMVSLDCTIHNEGNVAFFDVQISEAKLGMITSLETLEPGKSHVSAKKDVLDASVDYEFIVAARDANGNIVSLKSNKVSVTVVDAPEPTAAQSDALALRVVSDVATLAAPGPVSFTITVSNRGASSIEDVTLSEINIGAIENMETLPVGDKIFYYKAQVEDTRSFTFTVEGKTVSGQRVQDTAQSIEITLQTAATPPPISDLWKDDEKEQATALPILPAEEEETVGPVQKANALLVAMGIVGVLIALCVVVLIILVVRERSQRALYAQSAIPVQKDYDDDAYESYGEAFDDPPSPSERPAQGAWNDEDEVTRPVAQRRRSSSQEDVQTRPSRPRRH